MFAMKLKAELAAMVKEDTGNEVKPRAVIYQDLLWSEHVECRVVGYDGEVYSCLFDGDDKVGAFVAVPKENK